VTEGCGVAPQAPAVTHRRMEIAHERVPTAVSLEAHRAALTGHCYRMRMDPKAKASAQ
jgi:hypothetical protein